MALPPKWKPPGEERWEFIGFVAMTDPTYYQSEWDAALYLRGQSSEELRSFLDLWQTEQEAVFGPEATWPAYVTGWKRGALHVLSAAQSGSDIWYLTDIYGPPGEPFPVPRPDAARAMGNLRFEIGQAMVEWQVPKLDPLQLPAPSNWAYPVSYPETEVTPIVYLPEVNEMSFNLDSVADLASGIEQVVTPLAGAAVSTIQAVSAISGPGAVATPVAAVGAQPSYFGGYQLPTVQPALGMPFGDIVAPGQEAYLNRLMSPFRPTMAGARAQIHVLPNPMTGRPTFFGPLGKPLTFSRDRATVKRWKKHARDAKRLTGGR